jgi:hypothetical protein
MIRCRHALSHDLFILCLADAEPSSKKPSGGERYLRKDKGHELLC